MTDAPTTPLPHHLPHSDDTPLVFSLMANVLAELPAIGKNQENKEQGFHFRGYDDVMNALNPLLSKYGVFFVPRVLERLERQRQTRNGYTMYEVSLHVEYTFYGPDGSSVSASGWGEGTDMGDKSTAKAMTGALKYVLFQTFAISTQEASETDADRYSPPESNVDEAPCNICGTILEGARSNVEVARAHMVDQHGYYRLEDGRVAKTPPAPPADDAGAGQAATQQPDAPAPAAPPATEPAAPETPPQPAAEAQEEPPPESTPEPNPEPPADDPNDDPNAWVFDLKGDALKEQAKAWGVSTSLKAADQRQAIYDAVVAAETEDEGDGSAEDGLALGDAPEAAADAPPWAGKVTDEALAEIEAADPDSSTGQTWQCQGESEEGCATPPFESERDYYVHWYMTHDPLRPQPKVETKAAAPAPAAKAETPAAAPAGDVPLSDLIAQCKARMVKLGGDKARAYAAYRKDQGLGRPDDMTEEQALAMLAWFDQNEVPAA